MITHVIEDPEFLTVAEVAALLRLTPMSVYRMIRRGQLPARLIGPRVYRIRAADVRALIG